MLEDRNDPRLMHKPIFRSLPYPGVRTERAELLDQRAAEIMDLLDKNQDPRNIEMTVIVEVMARLIVTYSNTPTEAAEVFELNATALLRLTKSIFNEKGAFENVTAQANPSILRRREGSSSTSSGSSHPGPRAESLREEHQESAGSGDPGPTRESADSDRDLSR